MTSIVNRRDGFISDIMKMITSGTSNDDKIVLEDGEILDNKDVLSARSDYFATMFSNNSNKEIKFVEGETKGVPGTLEHPYLRRRFICQEPQSGHLASRPMCKSVSLVQWGHDAP